MSDEHNIDRLFQESFKDFEVDAPQSAWRGIEKRLNQKSKKRPIPIWQKLSGAAAIIAILIIVGSQWFLAPNQFNNNSIVDKRQQNATIIKNNNESKGVVTTNSDENLNEKNNSGISNQNKRVDTKTTKSSVQNQNQEDKSNSLVASNQDNRSTKSFQKHQITKNISTSIFEENLAFISDLTSKELIQSYDKNITAKPIENPTQNNSLLQKKSLVDVAKQLEQKNQHKSTQIENKSWFIKPQISPIFYGNLGSGSAVDPNLAQNDGQGEVNMSYGVNVAYQLNDKIKLRTGVNRVNLNYTTRNVYLIPNQAISNLRNVNTNPNFNASVLGRQQLDNLTANGTVNRTETIPSQLQQELGYIEIPMEVEYKILNRTIDINLIGGASTLLLNNNNLDIKNSNGNVSIGEANNINNLSFSTNFAIGFDYNISKRVMFNLEPTFKYQLNTFQSRTTDFQPYFLGVYSGLIFKF